MQSFLSSWLRHLLPLSTVVLSMVLALALSRNYPLMASFVPLFVIHYWSVPQPFFMPSWLVFALGLGQDLLLSTPFGLHALLWMVFYTCARSTSFAVQEGRIINLTLHYVVLSFLVPLMLAVLLFFQGRGLSGSWEILWGWGSASLVYPFVVLLLQKTERSLQASL